MDMKVKITSSALGIEASLSDANFVVSDPSRWSDFPMPREKRMCNYLDECMVQFHE